MKKRILPTTTITLLGVLLLASAPARSAEAGLTIPEWPAALAIHQDLEDLRRAKLKIRWSRPELETAHTNQPPAPPGAPQMIDPGQKGIDLVPEIDRAAPTGRPDLLLPPPTGFGDQRPGEGLESSLLHGGFTLGPVDPIDGGLVLAPAEAGSLIASPSVVPGPGVAALLIGAGFAAGRRRRRG